MSDNLFLNRMIIFSRVFARLIHTSKVLLQILIGHKLKLFHLIINLYQMRNECNFIFVIKLICLFNIDLYIRLNLIKMYQMQSILKLNFIQMLNSNIKHFNLFI